MRLAVMAFNEGRGVSPGDTHDLRLSQVPNFCPFNEGRGVSPGDTSALPTAPRRSRAVQ